MEIAFAPLLLDLIVILIAAKIGGELAERIGQPAVLGELVAGVFIGASVFSLAHSTEFIYYLSQLGIILLLFEVGISTNVKAFLSVGIRATIIAAIGVFFPFLGGYWVTHLLGFDTIHALFIGATLTATSVGITARVFSDLKYLYTEEARLVLGAAVADDVIGLIILAVMVGLMKNGSLSFGDIAYTTILAILFLAASLIIGLIAAPLLLKFINKMRVRGILITVSFAFCLALAFIADKIGLATIVGAFAAGLVLSGTEHQTKIEEYVKPLTDIFAPIFFVLMGMMVNIQIFNIFNPANYGILAFGGIILAVAIIGKLLSALGEIGRKTDKLIIGVGMIPRGEVGLIFASYGLIHKMIGSDIYSSILLVVITTTFITPPLLKILIARKSKQLA